MPIKPELRYFYPIDWPQISHWVRFVRAKGDSAKSAGGRMALLCSIWATAAGGTSNSRSGATEETARSPRLPCPRMRRC